MNEIIRQFANFANAQVQARHEDRVATMTAGERPVVDAQGHAWKRLGSRDDAFRAQNTAVRKAFADAIKSQFGVRSLDDIPKYVRDVLKLEDFELDAQGNVTGNKPLTARRIQAITARIAEVDSIDHRKARCHAIIQGALTKGVIGDLVHLVKNGGIGSAEALKAFYETHFAGETMQRLLDTMVEGSDEDAKAMYTAMADDLVSSLGEKLVEKGFTLAQLKPVHGALETIRREIRAQGGRSTFGENFVGYFAHALDTASAEIAHDSFDTRVETRRTHLENTVRNEDRAFRRCAKLITSERGRDLLLATASDALAHLDALTPDRRERLDRLLDFLAAHVKELGRERAYIFAQKVGALAGLDNGGAKGVNLRQARALLGTVVRAYSDLTEGDIRTLSTCDLADFALAAADDSLYPDRTTLTGYFKTFVDTAVRDHYTDAETAELADFINAYDNAPGIPEPPPMPPAPDRVLSKAERSKHEAAYRANAAVCDNLRLLGKLLHRDDAWNADHLGKVESVRDTLEHNRILLDSLVRNWDKPGVSLGAFSTATMIGLNLMLGKNFLTALMPNGEKPFTGAIGAIDNALIAFANAKDDATKNAAAERIGAQLDVLSDGLMDFVQTSLNANLNAALDKAGFGGNFKDLSKDLSPARADLLELAKKRHPVPRNETSAQKREREDAILADYAKLVVDPEAGGLGTLIKSLASNYVRELDVREQRAMLSGALLAIDPGKLTAVFNDNSLTDLCGKVVKGQMDEIKAYVSPDEHGDLPPPMEALVGDIAGGILKGAGPVLQKMVQMLGVDNLPPYLQQAVRDCKSNLRPIPMTYVESKLDELVRLSGGSIRAIRNPVSIGAASIAQAFRCELEDAQGQRRTIVVKMLRPDVRGRMEREIAAIRRSVRNAGVGALRTIKSRVDSLLGELDFGEERKNIVECRGVYGKGKTPYACLDSVRLAEGCPQLSDVLVMEEAKGQTFQRYMDATVKRLDDLLKGKVKVEKGRYVFTAMPDNELRTLSAELKTMYRDVRRRQVNLQRFVETWFTNALFGTGKFHGDLHGGNIMVDDEANVTAIDFGNAPSFTDADRKNVVKLIISTLRGKTEGVLDAALNLVSDDSKAVLAARRDALAAKLNALFRLGTLSNAQECLTAVFGEMSRAGIEVPEALYNFTEALGRVQQLSASMEKTLTRISGALPFLRPDTGVKGVDAKKLAGKTMSKDSYAASSRSIDEHIDHILSQEVQRLREDNPRITDREIFEQLDARAKRGEFERLFDVYEVKNPICAYVLPLMSTYCIKPDFLQMYMAAEDFDLYQKYGTVGRRMGKPPCPEAMPKMREIAKTRLEMAFAPFVRLDPAFAEILDEFKAFADDAFPGKYAYADGFMFYDFEFTASRLKSPDLKLTREQEVTRLKSRFRGQEITDEEAEFFATRNLRMRDIVVNRLLPALKRVFKDRMRAAVANFDLTGFAPPISMAKSMHGAVTSHVFKSLLLGGTGAIALGVNAAWNALKTAVTGGTAQIRGNFGMSTYDFRALAKGTEGRVHATKAKRIESTKFKAGPSIHNAEARRALVEALIMDSHVPEATFWRTQEGASIRRLLDLGDKETMDDVEAALPLTPAMVSHALAIHDLQTADSSVPAAHALDAYFGKPLREVTAAAFEPKLMEAVETVLGPDGANRFGLTPAALSDFLRSFYGQVLAGASEILAADPTYAQKGAAFTQTDVRRALVAALVETLRNHDHKEVNLLDVLDNPDVTAFANNELKRANIPHGTWMETALLLRRLGSKDTAEDLLKYAQTLVNGENIGSFRRPPTDKAKAHDESTREMLPLPQLARKLGFGMVDIACDKEFSQEFLDNIRDPQAYAKVRQRVREKIYLDNALPMLDAEEETMKIVQFWLKLDELANPKKVDAPAPQKDEDDDDPVIDLLGGAVDAGKALLGGLFGWGKGA